MKTLPPNLRRQLENAITQARGTADGGARKALEALAVHEPDPYRHMDEAQRDLRRKLRAQARQLGDGESKTRPGAYEIKHLVEKLAYDQWHRLLFARFLLENNLLVSPEHGVSISLDDCEELAPSVGLEDAWAVAARFAANELPEIFRADDPAGAVELAAEDRKPLIQLVTGLPIEVFIASDSLGWCYQFWQTERKDEVNATGNKIGADELPAVTQLFTEDYMVDFLLDNTLGAWHAGKVLAAKPPLAEAASSEDELRNATALPGCLWKYLRFVKSKDGKWAPAAGTFAGWPQKAKELKCLDPCMGSGHFVVAMFESLVALRMAEENLNEAAAVPEVIRDNLFGLEIDPRCTQIGAFNLALTAWRRVGHCNLPVMNLACSGVGPNTREADWLAIAGDSEKLRNGMERLYRLFKNAPVLGSLIDPRLNAEDMYVADYRELEPLLEKALALETKNDPAHEMAATARGLAKAAEILAGQFTLVATNVPYLGMPKQNDDLRQYCQINHPDAKGDLAYCFQERSLGFCSDGGTTALVSLQNWLYLVTYKKLRSSILSANTLNFIAGLGPRSFQTPMYDFNVMLGIITNRVAPELSTFFGVDLSRPKSPDEKSNSLKTGDLALLEQSAQFANPDYRISLEFLVGSVRLSSLATSHLGICTGDYPRFGRGFWELETLGRDWSPQHSTVRSTCHVGGMSGVLFWEDGKGAFYNFLCDRLGKEGINSWLRGGDAWGKKGVVVTAMGDLPVSLYYGNLFDNNVTVIIPGEPEQLAPIWSFCESPDFRASVRRINQKLSITDQSMVEVPFDLTFWQKVAAEKYPNGLPKPFSSDPTQWLFNGHPKDAKQPLHVAVARLLGYRWPRQTGSGFPDCPALGPDGLEKLADQDGIVCLSPTKGESRAADRLRGLLVQALGDFDLSSLIANAGSKGSKCKTLEDWLRDDFFDQHCEIFHDRPFIWHVWDGHKSGFSALVNYHQLTHANLEKLTYAYLGDWIRRQQAAVDAGEAGSDARLLAAKQLQSQLKLILEGEPPYDIFVRWKPLSQQAIGWHPDLNDGVRVNIRPFLAQDIPGGKKGAGILRARPNIKWGKDRGKEPMRNKTEFPWFWGWDEEKLDFPGIGKEPDGNCWNDCHYTNEFKQRARKAQ